MARRTISETPTAMPVPARWGGWGNVAEPERFPGPGAYSNSMTGTLGPLGMSTEHLRLG
jgi:hypothetical protein